MKILSTANVCVFGVVLASARISHAARETLAISEGGVTFTIVRYDDGRNKPYRLQFRQDGIRSLYMFNTAGFVTNVKVDAERYKVRRRRTPPRNAVCYGRPSPLTTSLTRFD